MKFALEQLTVNVIDVASLTPELPKVVEDLPAGAKRLTQVSRGIKATIVNGRVLLKDGTHTGDLLAQLQRLHALCRSEQSPPPALRREFRQM